MRDAYRSEFGSTTSAEEDDDVPRELVEPTDGDKRYVRRDKEGRFHEVVDVGSALTQDRRREAQHETKKGDGDRGDRRGS